jgi:presenilin-like A22 family membrane protease
MNTKEGHSLSQNLHLDAHQVSTGVAIFYVGYLLFDLPFNLVMTKLAPQAWISRIVVTIGVRISVFFFFFSSGQLQLTEVLDRRHLPCILKPRMELLVKSTLNAFSCSRSKL